MKIEIYGACTYGELEAGNVFIHVVEDKEPRQIPGFYLWRKMKNGHAEMFGTARHLSSELVWAFDRESMAALSNDMPVIKIGT